MKRNDNILDDEARAQRLCRIADDLTEKVAQWVAQLDPQEAPTQSIRQICATLKDIKDIQMIRTAQEEAEYRLKMKKLSRELEGEQKHLTVTIEGGDEAWKN